MNLHRLTFLDWCWLRRHRSRHRTVNVRHVDTPWAATTQLACLCGARRHRIRMTTRIGARR